MARGPWLNRISKQEIDRKSKTAIEKGSSSTFRYWAERKRADKEWTKRGERKKDNSISEIRQNPLENWRYSYNWAIYTQFTISQSMQKAYMPIWMFTIGKFRINRELQGDSRPVSKNSLTGPRCQMKKKKSITHLSQFVHIKDAEHSSFWKYFSFKFWFNRKVSNFMSFSAKISFGTVDAKSQF